MSAGVGLLSSVDPDVVGEEPGPGECLGAVGALVVPVVGLHVHGQGWHGGVELPALPAVFPGVGVDLSVSGEVAAGGVVLTALGAGVLWLALLDHNLLLLRSTVTCKKGLEIFRILENISTF